MKSSVSNKIVDLNVNFIPLKEWLCQLEKHLDNANVSTPTIQSHSAVPKMLIDKSREIINCATHLLCGTLRDVTGVDGSHLVSEICGLINYDPSLITNSFCIGKVQPNNKIHLLKIQFVSPLAVQNFYICARKCLQSIRDKFPKVWFGLDQCAEEQEFQTNSKQKFRLSEEFHVKIFISCEEISFYKVLIQFQDLNNTIKLRTTVS